MPETFRARAQSGVPPALFGARAVAAALVCFIGVGTISFLSVSAAGKSLLVLGTVASAVLCAWLRGREFFVFRIPIPECLLVLSWLAFVVAWGRLWIALSTSSTVLLLFLAPMIAAVALLWSAIRAIVSPSAQNFVAVAAATPSLVFFLSLIAKL